MGDLPEKVIRVRINVCAHIAILESSFDAHQQSTKIYEEEHEKCDDDASLCKKATSMKQARSAALATVQGS
jgi:hypothetical protein